MSPLDSLTDRVGRFAIGDVVRIKPTDGRRLPSDLRGEWRISKLHDAEGMEAYADLGAVGVPHGPCRSIVVDRLVRRRKQHCTNCHRSPAKVGSLCLSCEVG